MAEEDFCAGAPASAWVAEAAVLEGMPSSLLSDDCKDDERAGCITMGLDLMAEPCCLQGTDLITPCNHELWVCPPPSPDSDETSPTCSLLQTPYLKTVPATAAHALCRGEWWVIQPWRGEGKRSEKGPAGNWGKGCIHKQLDQGREIRGRRFRKAVLQKEHTDATRLL